MRVILQRYELAALIASNGMATLWYGTDRPAQPESRYPATRLTSQDLTVLAC
jgi:hypothetical protein